MGSPMEALMALKQKMDGGKPADKKGGFPPKKDDKAKKPKEGTKEEEAQESPEEENEEQVKGKGDRPQFPFKGK